MREEIDLEKYREYFTFHEDGSFSVRKDFVNEIKKLKGKLHTLYEYLLGDDDKRFPNPAYSTKEEDDCSYRYIPKSLRWDIYERDNFTCQKCGSRRYLSVDHIVPKSKGGKTSLDNCQTLCTRCNSKKGAK